MQMDHSIFRNVHLNHSNSESFGNMYKVLTKIQKDHVTARKVVYSRPFACLLNGFL